MRDYVAEVAVAPRVPELPEGNQMVIIGRIIIFPIEHVNHLKIFNKKLGAI